MNRIMIAAVGALATLGAAGSAIAAELPTRVHYEVRDGDKPVGHIDITIEPSAQGFVAHQRGELTLRRMMITAKVTQSIDERWQDRRLLSLDSDTASEMTIGGARKTLAVARDASGTLRATADKKTRELPADALPLSIWYGPALVAGTHFDVTSGDLVDVQPAADARADAPLRYQGDECRPLRLATRNADKKTSQVSAWVGSDGIVCEMRISSGSDVFTYTRQPPP